MVKKYYILNTKGVNILDIGELLSNGEGNMLRPTAIQVEAVCEYKILVEFDNGEKNILMLNHI